MATPAPIMRSRSPSPLRKSVTIKSGRAGTKRPKAAAKHPKTLYMICQAIFALKDRKGASTQSIKKHIMDNYKDIPVNRLNVMLKRAFVLGLKSGALVRPKGSTATGATGRFRVGSMSLAKAAGGKPKKTIKKKPKMKKAKKPAKAKKGKTAKKVKKTTKGPKKTKKPKVKKAKKATTKPKTKKIVKKAKK